MDSYEIILRHRETTGYNKLGEDLYPPLHVRFIYDPELEDRVYVLNMYFDQLIKADDREIRRHLQNG